MLCADCPAAAVTIQMCAGQGLTYTLYMQAESHRTGQLRFGLEYSLTTKEEHTTVVA